MPELTNAYELPVPFEQQQAAIEDHLRKERWAGEAAELAALEKKLKAQGYDPAELEKDNPYNQWMNNSHDS